MGDMGPIAQHHLQSVGAGREFDHRFGLAFAKVAVIIVHLNRGFQRLARQCCVNQEVMMTGIFGFIASGGNTHARQAELHKERAFDRSAIGQVDEIDLGTGRGWGFLGKGCTCRCDKDRCHKRCDGMFDTDCHVDLLFVVCVGKHPSAGKSRWEMRKKG